MNNSDILGLILAASALLVLSMLFSAAESAFLSVSRLRIRFLKQKKNKKAIRAGKLLENKEQLINTILIGNNVVNITLSSIITAICIRLFGNKGVAAATFGATVLLLIFGEIAPKTFGTHYPEKTTFSLSGFISIAKLILSPIAIIFTKFSLFILGLFRIKPTEKKATFSEEDIKTLMEVGEEEGVLESSEKQMMHRVFKFTDLEAKDIMRPRPAMITISEKARFRDAVELAQKTHRSRFPVYGEDIDDIIGILYMKDALLYAEKTQDFLVKKVMRPPLYILGTKKITSVQELLFESHHSMAVIVDEYSGTDGVITEKDISREIFALPGENSLRGKVFDFDAVEDKTDFVINGSVLLRDLKEDLHIALESNINDTIGGWFAEQIDRMPEPGDSVEFEGWIFTIKKIQAHRVERIQLSKIPAPENEATQEAAE